MAISNRVKLSLQKQFVDAYLPKFQQKVIPEIKKDIRIDSGNLRDNTEANASATANAEPVIRVSFNAEYAGILELKSGIFKDGSRYGTSLAANYQEYAKFAND